MFLDITFFGRSAEIANQYLRKGSKIFVTGRLKLDQWTDNNTGAKRSKHTLTVQEFKMLDPKPTDGNENRGNGAPQTNAYNQNGQSNPNYDPNPKNGYSAPQTNTHATKQTPIPEIDIDDQDIPF